MGKRNNCIHWGENVFPYFDDGCHIGHSWCNPEECDDFQPAFVENQHGKCPKCGSVYIDQESAEHDVIYYHCYDCGCWYTAEGEVDEEDGE